jgi:ArsR family transcriptional regulator
MNSTSVDIIRLAGYKVVMETTCLIFKALSEEPRLRILNLLLTHGELCVCDIMAALELPQSTASRHLAYLKKTGWVDDRREAVWIHYSIARDTQPLLQDLVPLLKRHLAASGVTIADQQRLEAFSRHNSCA